MNDPKRWLDEGGGGTAEERALLESGREVTMPSAVRKRVWLGIAAGVAGVGASAGAAAGGTVGLLSGTAAKTVLVAALLGAAGLGVTVLRSGGHPTVASINVRTRPSEEVEARKEPGAPLPANPNVVETTEATGRAPAEHKPWAPVGGPNARSTPASPPSDELAPSRTEPETRATSHLREESAAVVAIRQKLLSGDPVEALRMLDRARAEFPNGALVQEREALAVRALVESGQKEAARKRGEAFLRAFPRSPYEAEVRALLAP
jgi:hypothetical protein